MKKLDVLAGITFGQRVAEDETDELTRYFVETDLWRRLFSGEVDVVYGPKGAGKSALYALLTARSDQLFDRAILLAPAENPRGAPAFRGLVADPPADEAEFIGLWKLYIACLLAELFEDYGIKGGSATTLRDALEREHLIQRPKNLSGIVRGVADYVRQGIRGASLEGGVEVESTTGLIKGFTGKITFQEPSAAGKDRGYLSIDYLLAESERALAADGLSAWILLDRLDVAFAESALLEQNALRALFHVYLDLLGHPHIRLKIFLRSDIWERITKAGFREASHITRHMTISWDPRTLLNLVVKRAIQNRVLEDFYKTTPDAVLASTESQEAFLYRMVPRQVDVGPNKPNTFEWMLGRTRDGTGQTAPRELIHLLNCLREVQVRRLEVGDKEPDGEELFVRAAFKDALTAVSRVRLEQTLYAEYPAFRRRLDALRKEKTLHTARTLAKIWGIQLDEAATIAHELVDLGVFEQRGSKEDPQYWVPFLYRDALDMVQGTADE